MCLPAAANFDAGDFASVYTDAGVYCLAQRAFLIVDIPQTITTPGDTANTGMTNWIESNTNLGNRNGAVYFPRLIIPDPLNGNNPRNVGVSGTLAGVYARTDAARGVWKAPAGTQATLVGVTSLQNKVSDGDNGALNELGVNVLRSFPVYGSISWGARTLEGSDQLASEWKYIPVRRLTLFIEQSLFEGLKWAVFEPNDETLWSQIRTNVGAFMGNLYGQGAFAGSSASNAYLVKCDADTTTSYDQARGIVNIIVGFAPVDPAEFVILQIEQLAGQTS